MALVRVNVMCCDCGKMFEIRKEKYSRREADAYEKWAKEASLTCPECHKKKEAQIIVNALEKYGITLPELTAVSEKQKEYANNVRNRMIADNISRIGKYLEFQKAVEFERKNQDFIRLCEDKGLTFEQAIAENRAYHQLDTLEVAFTATSAKEILDYHE